MLLTCDSFRDHDLCWVSPHFGSETVIILWTKRSPESIMAKSPLIELKQI